MHTGETAPADTGIMNRAAAWVQATWNRAQTEWADRGGQDLSYRDHVIHPALCDILARYRAGDGMRIVDLGCGDGVLLSSERFRDLVGRKGTYLGIDMSTALIDRARMRPAAFETRFRVTDLADSAGPGTLADLSGTVSGQRWDAVVSVFVAQEIPDITAFLRNLAGLVGNETVAVMITVHPAFAEGLREDGAVLIETSLGDRDRDPALPWRWAGGYPIVDETQGVFHLPHFQRSVEDYRELFRNTGLMVKETVGLPGAETREALVAERISPFVPFDDNVYWPRIAGEPSALALVARKEHP